MQSPFNKFLKYIGEVLQIIPAGPEFFQGRKIFWEDLGAMVFIKDVLDLTASGSTNSRKFRGTSEKV
jgi:hypothetical protein